MRYEVIQGSRVRLQKRWRRLRGSGLAGARYALLTFRQAILDEPLCLAAVEDLALRVPIAPESPTRVVEAKGGWTSASEAEAASFAWAVLGELLARTGDDGAKLHSTVFSMARALVRPAPETVDGCWSLVITHYLEPLFEYLDEALDDQADLLAALVRFQTWAAFFGHPFMADVIAAGENAVSKGERKAHDVEKRLQGLMFERLFLDGLALSDIAREPLTGVGRQDFRVAFRGRPVAVEVKLFGQFGATTYSVSGLRDGVCQLLAYMEEANTSTGYLVIFNRDPRGVRLRVPEHHDGVPHLRVSGHRTVYLLVVAATGPGPASDAVQPVEVLMSDLLPGDATV